MPEYFDLISRRYTNQPIKFAECEECGDIALYVYRHEDNSLSGITFGVTKWLCESCMKEYCIKSIKSQRLTGEEP
jgi:hypothetical protein